MSVSCVELSWPARWCKGQSCRLACASADGSHSPSAGICVRSRQCGTVACDNRWQQCAIGAEQCESLMQISLRTTHVIIRLELCRTVCGVCEQDGRTALLCACAHGRLDVAQWLVTSGGSDARSERNNVRILCGAVVRSGGVRGSRVVWRVREQTGRTALLLASAVGHVNVVQWLVTSVGIDVRSESERDNVGRRCVVFL
jgi:ankyrin repeat protein